MRFVLLFFVLALFCGCQPAFDYVEIAASGEYGPEKAFLESLWEGGEFEALKLRLLPKEAESGDKPARPALIVEFFSSWLGNETVFGDILISRTAMVPRDDALAGRTNTSLAACLEGGETLIPPEDIAPPSWLSGWRAAPWGMRGIP